MRALEAGEGQASSLFAQFRDWRSRLSNAEFSVHRERVHFRAPQQLEVEPELALRLFEFVGAPRHPPVARRPSSASKRACRACATISPTPQPLWPALSANCWRCRMPPLAVRAMHETGVLTALFPEFEQIECLVIRDFYHRYTVDEHTLVTMQNLWSLRSHDRCLRAAASAICWPRSRNRASLAFALLFHDAGKGTPGRRPRGRFAAPRAGADDVASRCPGRIAKWCRS